MKLLFFITFLMSFFPDGVLGGGGTSQIYIEHRSLGGHHFQYPVPADMPDVYYNQETEEIIIDGNGMATSYTVDIISTTTLIVMQSEIVGGNYDSIDVSSLPGDDYKIVIVSSNNNTYEGYFNNE